MLCKGCLGCAYEGQTPDREFRCEHPAATLLTFWGWPDAECYERGPEFDDDGEDNGIPF